MTIRRIGNLRVCGQSHWHVHILYMSTSLTIFGIQKVPFLVILATHVAGAEQQGGMLRRRQGRSAPRGPRSSSANCALHFFPIIDHTITGATFIVRRSVSPIEFTRCSHRLIHSISDPPTFPQWLRLLRPRCRTRCPRCPYHSYRASVPHAFFPDNFATISYRSRKGMSLPMQSGFKGDGATRRLTPSSTDAR